MVAHLYLITMLGGLLIGLAAGTVLVAIGPVAGRSGMVDSVVRRRSSDAAWQVTLLLGLVVGGSFLSWLDPAALPVGQVAPIQLMVGAGLLMGFCARRGEGRQTLRGWRLSRPWRSEIGNEKDRPRHAVNPQAIGWQVRQIRL